MSQEKQVPSDVMMNSVVTMVQSQDQRIKTQEEKLTRMEEKMDAAADNLKGWEAAKATILEMMAVGKDQKALMEKLSQFFRSLNIAVDVLRHPPENKIQHHHHVTKIAWITAGLFIALCFVSSGWFMTAEAINMYKGGDIKYRKLKLISDSSSLRYLWRLDSLYLAEPSKMEKEVKEQEELNQEHTKLRNQIDAVENKIKKGKEKRTKPKTQ